MVAGNVQAAIVSFPVHHVVLETPRPPNTDFDIAFFFSRINNSNSKKQ
jgi:hypothetical protein